jgi:spore maturation protein SpmB
MGGMAKGMLMALGVAFVGIAALEIGPREWRGAVLQGSGIKALVDEAQATKAVAVAVAKPGVVTGVSAPVVVVAEEPAWRRMMNGVSGMAIPAILLLAIGLSLAKGVKVYEEFIDGAKEGFTTAIRIMPFLVAMFAALAVFRGSGMLMLLQAWLSPALAFVGFPADLLPLALMRPLSGSGASAILNEILAQPDISTAVKYTAGILFGSTETTFYVIAVYFGSVGIRRVRHALAAGLCADLVGMVAAVVIGRMMF